MRCRVLHGARFERLVEQPTLMHMVVYMTSVDPGASRTHGAAMAGLTRMLGAAARLFGVRPVLDDEEGARPARRASAS